MNQSLALGILAELVVQLQPDLDVRHGVALVVIAGRGGRREEVEEGFRRDRLLDDTGLLGVYSGPLA